MEDWYPVRWALGGRRKCKGLDWEPLVGMLGLVDSAVGPDSTREPEYEATPARLATALRVGDPRSERTQALRTLITRYK